MLQPRGTAGGGPWFGLFHPFFFFHLWRVLQGHLFFFISEEFYKATSMLHDLEAWLEEVCTTTSISASVFLACVAGAEAFRGFALTIYSLTIVCTQIEVDNERLSAALDEVRLRSAFSAPHSAAASGEHADSVVLKGDQRSSSFKGELKEPIPFNKFTAHSFNISY